MRWNLPGCHQGGDREKRTYPAAADARHCKTCTVLRRASERVHCPEWWAAGFGGIISMRDLRNRAGWVVAVVVLLSAGAARAVNYTEGTDLSSDPNNPTVLGSFGLGTHSITATSAGGDQDDFTFTIPAGHSLDSVVVGSYNSPLGDNTAFIGIAAGTSIPDQGLAPGNLLGYTHFGPGGGDILDDIGAAFDAIGFTPPLGPGNYSVWTQQAGSSATYRLDFVVTPEPSSLSLVALGAVALLRRRRHGA
jgi:hypothetical protein